MKQPLLASSYPRIILGLLLLHASLWTLIPAWTGYSLPLDVVEGLFWGQEWQWGYYKHPPLPAWLIQLSWMGLGDYGPFFLSQLSILFTLLFVGLLGRRLLGAEAAWLGILLTLGVYYFIWPTPEYNHNIAQMPFWAAAVWLFHRGIHSGAYRDWLALGLVVGLGMLTKYVMVMLLASMCLYLLITPKARVQLQRLPLWTGVLLSLAVFAPHLVWLIQNDFLPLTYMSQRSGEALTWSQRFYSPAKFLLVQLLDHLPVFLILALAGLFTRDLWSRHASAADERRFLWVLGLGPAFFTVLWALFGGNGLRDMWGTPMWNLSGLLLVCWWRLPLSIERGQKLLKVMSLYLLLMLLLYTLVHALLPHFKTKPSRTGWPDKAMAQALASVWQAETGCTRVGVVAGDYWLAGLASLRLEARPSVWIQGQYAYSPWITPERIAEQGVLWIWQGQAEQPAALQALLQDSLLQTPAAIEPAQGVLELEWPRGRAAPLELHWALMPPRHCP
ncbi:glycosyltransferase family 39 protein [Nitrincola tapanii]|uniref:Glycosyltransferase family 39 protein n=1 Tax=Nitrincola tapanii TaxID=1708751 RepID=A0A5A9W2N7_9GAMM|nr:glycosyltransferase family 39 protein [Nitrincola tapanii]KAA0874355.1 glycosyltransferase family 39 protein [Nitrincola tapanii]